VQKRASPPEKLIYSTRIDMEADFSPDGKKIAFVSNRTGSDEIWISDSDGSHARQSTSVGLSVLGCRSPRWSPDGEQIVFEGLERDRGGGVIYIVSANGGKPRLFTHFSGMEGRPSWSRDGKWIYFASERTGEPQVWKAPVGGGEAVQVTRKGGLVAFESLDGKWLYYIKTHDFTGLWKAPRDGGKRLRCSNRSTHRPLP
jgi:Tol biopolymer transport system component